MTGKTSNTKRYCRLCGYPSEDYMVLQVPLACPPQDNAICTECLDDILSKLEVEKSYDTEDCSGRCVL